MKVEATLKLRRTGAKKTLKPPAPSPLPKVPRIAKLMALAIKMQDMVDRGEVENYAELARLAGVSRARITQIMNLNLLPPKVQEELLFSLV